MPITRFVPTHIIKHRGRRIMVAVVDHACYRQIEWMRGNTLPDYELDNDGIVMFQGERTAATIKPIIKPHKSRIKRRVMR